MIVELDGIGCKKLLADGNIAILDVRAQGEFLQSRIPGAIHIDILDNNAVDAIAKLEKNIPYLVYCSVGVRSRSAVKIMNALGFVALYHLSNGLPQYLGQLDDTILQIV